MKRYDLISKAVLTTLAILFCSMSYAVEYHHPLQFMEKIKSAPNKGKQIYQNMCANCHATTPMIKVGAPRFRMLNDWKARQKKGIAQLVKNLQDNLGIMPARGGCFECSDEDLAKAIHYMLPKKQTKKSTST